MKPVFEKEHKLLETKMGIKLPKNIWRHGQSLYLNSDFDTCIIKFKVKKRKDIVIEKNYIESVLDKYKNKTFLEEIEESKEMLEYLEKESIEKTIDFIKKYPGYELRPSISGGKDSDLMWHILYKKVFPRLNIENYTLDFMNSTNETAQTYLHIKNNFPKDKMQINNPPKGIYTWLKEDKEYYIPTIASRICCSTYKEGRIKKILNKNTNYIIFLGARKDESPDRSEYDWDLNERMNELYAVTKKEKYKLYIPANWKRFLPILNWKDKYVWLYILKENIKYNEQYNMGFSRCGCLICPYMSSYNELLIQEYYPFLAKRWDDMLETHYEVKNVERRLKYTKEEFINEGMWKSGAGKEQSIITKKPTPERIQELARIKRCSVDIAAKYFKRECNCGKKLNADEVGMFLKFFGRYEKKATIETLQAQMSLFDDERDFSGDDRKYLCKTCFCNHMGIRKEQYDEKLKEFRNTGCNLF